jgi:Family of unknown function (DUF6481)
MGAITGGMNRQRAGKIVNTQQDDKGFRERLNAAAEAKKAALDKFRARAAPDDPAVTEAQSARQAVSAEDDVTSGAETVRREADATRKKGR